MRRRGGYLNLFLYFMSSFEEIRYLHNNVIQREFRDPNADVFHVRLFHTSSMHLS